MKINHNMSATITNAQLLRTESSLADSMERLSSGLKLNHAKDDPSGMAISNKLQAQIDGLDQASENAQNGSSLLQIADGALNETTSIIQRMRELSVQAASDTMTTSDKEAIQQEIDALKEEVDRIARDTEYNTKKILDGSSDVRVYSQNASNFYTSDSVDIGIYNLIVEERSEPAMYTTNATTAPSGAGNTIGAAETGTVTINGVAITVEEGDTASEVFAKIRDGAELAGCEVNVYGGAAVGTNLLPEFADKDFTFGDRLFINTEKYSASAELKITCDNADLAAVLGLHSMTDGQVSEVGKTGVTKIARVVGSGFENQSTATVSMDGNKVTVKNRNGFELSFDVDPDFTGNVAIDVTGIGAMTLQIGANEHQTMDVKIPKVNCESLEIEDLNVVKVDGGGEAITALDKALERVNSIRSRIGAYENRLEYASTSLDQSSEDMTSALSRIADVDMAKEMTEYTKYSVLDQAAISVLSQANEMPQTVLSLLQ